jgi:[ribosomal protein S5]-alanine N-acetyltransferase
MKIFAETERLILRELLPSDLDGMFELYSDPQVHKYIGNKIITDKNQIIEVINFVRQQYIDNGIGRWAISEKRTDNFIGWTGFKYITELTNCHQNFYDLGYRLIRKYWGQGIATETAIVALDYAFNKLNVNEVYATASYENAASNKILKKVGLSFIETFYFENIMCNWYKIDKSDYENKKPNR